MEVRDAHESELAELTRLWYDSWRDSHAHLLPSEGTFALDTWRYEKTLSPLA
jgi:hypothetical protein